MSGTAGINVWSGSPGLGAALTNPTCLAKRKGSLREDYPVEFRGRTYPDAEAAYHAHAKGLPFDDQRRVCALVVEAKLRQHPRLVEAVTAKGGTAWLERCVHLTGARTEAFRRWEGRGRESAYLSALIEAYEAVTKNQPLGDPRPAGTQGTLFG